MLKRLIDPRFGAIVVALWLPGLALGVAAAGDGVLSGDLSVARRVQGWDGPVFDAVAAYGNWIGHFWVGLVITIPVVALLARLRRWREIAALAAVLLVRALSNPTKALFDSPRPPVALVRVTEEAHGLGYPSGHASGTLLLCGALILIGHRLPLPVTFRAGLWVVGVGTILASGFGRVQTGVHWPSDVLGGYVIGLASLLTLAAIVRISRPVSAGNRRWRQGTAPDAGLQPGAQT